MADIRTHLSETICAVATPHGVGGVGIIRISGPLVKTIATFISGEVPKPRYAHFSTFLNKNKEIIDQGISLYFPGPNSFTGEDVIEFQAHGGPIILDQLMQEIITCGARIA